MNKFLVLKIYLEVFEVFNSINNWKGFQISATDKSLYIICISSLDRKSTC